MKRTVRDKRLLVGMLLLVLGFGPPAVAQWNVNERAWTPPPFANYFSAWPGSNAPPLPSLPYDLPVYYLGTFQGIPNAFLYDDRDLASALLSRRQTDESEPPWPEGEYESGSESNPPPVEPYAYGKNLYLTIGPTNTRLGSCSLTRTT